MCCSREARTLEFLVDGRHVGHVFRDIPDEPLVPAVRRLLFNLPRSAESARRPRAVPERLLAAVLAADARPAAELSRITSKRLMACAWADHRRGALPRPHRHLACLGVVERFS